MREYRDCYVAYLDILGFKNFILNTTTTCEAVAQVFDELRKQRFLTIEETGKKKRDFVPRDAIHFKIMSDSVVIFMDASIENALLDLIITCIDFQMRMLNLDSFTLVRGGITRGEVYSDDETLFGPGLVNAYCIEEEAKYPRILVPHEIVDNYQFNNDDGKFQLLLKGLLINYPGENDYSLDYITQYLAFYHNKGYDRRMEEIVLQKLQDTDVKIQEKYLYLQEMIERFKQLKEKN